VSHILVNGMVAYRDKMPYIQIDIDGHTVQLSMADARNVARDIERMCARTEADAMIHKFFSMNDFPEGANAAIMLAFREFRSKLDSESVDKFERKPED
jgi:hypothetical protein